MDKLKRYQTLLRELLTRQVELAPSHGRLETAAVCDDQHNQYLLVDMGWDKTGRVHAVAFHARLQNGQVWIEWDGTMPSLTERLVAAGVPQEDIVLAFYRPEHRPEMALA
jgi:hypothetical protein